MKKINEVGYFKMIKRSLLLRNISFYHLIYYVILIIIELKKKKFNLI